MLAAAVAFTLVQTALPEGEPVDLDLVKAQLRRDPSFTDDDDWLTGRVTAARQTVEGDTGRQLLPATFELRLPGFPCGAGVIRPPVAPLLAVTGITYLDAAGDSQTLSTAVYAVSAPTGDRASYGTISLKDGQSWPATLSQADAVVVTCRAGYDEDVLVPVPEALKDAILLLVAHRYAHREPVVVDGSAATLDLAYDALIADYRLYPLPVLD